MCTAIVQLCVLLFCAFSPQRFLMVLNYMLVQRPVPGKYEPDKHEDSSRKENRETKISGFSDIYVRMYLYLPF